LLLLLLLLVLLLLLLLLYNVVACVVQFLIQIFLIVVDSQRDVHNDVEII